MHRTASGFQAGEPIGPTTAGMPGEADQFCAFGFVLASGDVHGDGPDDLVVATRRSAATTVESRPSPSGDVGDARRSLSGRRDTRASYGVTAV